MAEQRTMLVLLAMACSILEARGAHVAVAQTICSSTDPGGCQSGSAHSANTGSDGITRGACAYLKPDGQSVEIKYEQAPDGQITQAYDRNNEAVPFEELQQCREAVAAQQLAAQENFNAIQAEQQALQEQIQRQHQQLQEQIFRQQQAIFNQRNFPFPNGFNPIQFPNFPQVGLGGF